MEKTLSDKRIIVDEATEIDAEIVYLLRSDVKYYLNKFIEGIRTNPIGYMQETGEGRIVIADWEKLKLLELETFGEDLI